MEDEIIIDADLCIKLGGSSKYSYLYDVLPMVSKKIYMHTYAYEEVMMPISAVKQLKELIREDKVVLINESDLDSKGRVIYEAAYNNLAKVMLDPTRPCKNKGEICSLSYAKATGIPIFATDEKDLQPIIDKILNTGMDDITCLRIIDIILKAKDGEIELSRKIAKALWLVAGKKKEIFDHEIWNIIEQ